MIRYLTTFLLTVSLFTAARASCEQETADLNDCLAGDCKTCLAVDVVAWTSCSDLQQQFCDAMDQCSDPCGASCMDVYKQWATCYVGTLPYQEDCELDCGTSGRMDETSGSSATLLTKQGFFITLIFAALV